MAATNPVIGEGVVKEVWLAREVLDGVLGSLQTLFSYLLLPLALPFLFFQECLAWFREITGLNNRAMEGKVVLITGASSGIGETLAHKFYSCGCRLILASRRREELERVKDDLLRQKSTGGSRVHVPAVLEMDLGDIKSIPAKARVALAIFGDVDILVNNAGILHSGNVLDTELDVDRKVMDVNYFGTLALTKVVGNAMKARKSGHIVFMSSVSGKISIPHSSAYSASKHAMQALGDSLRAEVSEDGIKVTMICPGYVRTNISKNALSGDGTPVGTTSKNIATGLDPEYVAERVVKAVERGEKDVVISPLVPKLAIFLRYTTPSLFFLLMRRMGRAYNKREAEKKAK